MNSKYGLVIHRIQVSIELVVLVGELESQKKIWLLLNDYKWVQQVPHDEIMKYWSQIGNHRTGNKDAPTSRI